MQKVLYNVTVRIGHEKHIEWLEWMQKHHIPDVMATGRFLSYRMHKIIGDEAQDGVTYAIGYVAKNQNELDLYQTHDAPSLQQDHQQRFGGFFGAFRTIMQIVDEG